MVNKSAAMMQTSTLVLLVHFILVLPSARARPGRGAAGLFIAENLSLKFQEGVVG
jgi:hypothetical protein